MKSDSKHNSGMILVLAMLIIAAVMGTATVFGNLIIKEIRQSRLIDNSIQAYYSTESGVERALYQVRKRQAVNDCDKIDKFEFSECQSATAYCSGALDGKVSCISDSEDGLDVVDGWQITANNEESLEIFLAKGQSFQIDFFDPNQKSENPDVGDLKSGVGSISVEWGDETHEVSLYHTLSTLNLNLQTQVVEKFIVSKYTVPPNSPFPRYQFTFNQPIVDKAYTLRLSAEQVKQEAGRVIISAYEKNNRGGEPVNIPNYLTIESTGDHGDSLQKIKVKTPTRPSLSGLYDFVVFSEEKIVK